MSWQVPDVTVAVQIALPSLTVALSVPVMEPPPGAFTVTEKATNMPGQLSSRSRATR